MTAVTYLTRHRRPGIVILCSIVAVLSMLFVLPPAIASAADSGAQAVDECNPTASNGCVNGILQDADKKPIADVTITLSGKATAETKTAAARASGRFPLADDGRLHRHHRRIRCERARSEGKQRNGDDQESQLRQAARSRPFRPGWRFHRQRHVRHIRIDGGHATQGAVRRKRDDRKCRTAPFAGGTRVEYMRSVRGRCVERVVKHTSFTGEKVDFSGN